MGCVKSKEKDSRPKKAEIEVSNQTYDPQKYEQAGGHGGGVKFTGDRVTKETKLEEVINYRKIFNEFEPPTSLTKMREFLPKYHDDGPHEKDAEKWMITVENLLFGKENGSFVDLKLGTSTLTSDKDEQQIKIA